MPPQYGQLTGRQLPGLAGAAAVAAAVPIVDPDAVLSDPIPFQWLQPVARRSQEFAQLGREVQHSQFSPRRGFDIGETGNPFALEQPFGIGAAERLDHHGTIARFT
jgi:hypothetical protein